MRGREIRDDRPTSMGNLNSLLSSEPNRVFEDRDVTETESMDMMVKKVWEKLCQNHQTI